MVTVAPVATRTSRTSRTSRISVRPLGPNWYATVMGTAIVATAGAGLPARVPGARAAYVAVWALSALLLLTLVAARARHWKHHSDQARAHLADPAVAPFYGCLAMALLAVGGATLAVGRDVLGSGAAVAVAGALWVAGTAVGLLAAAGIPYLLITRHRMGPADASAVWLLPVVAPMVSAAVGPGLVPELPAGQWRAALWLVCSAQFGLSLLATLVLLPLVMAGLLRYGPPAPALVPTLFLGLGPRGQSTTALANLAAAAPGTLPAPYPDAASAGALLYGVPVLGFALWWLVLAGALVVRAARRGMPYAMTWWAFTFPVGTCVTGAAGLARQTDVALLRWLAFGLYALLVVAWAVAGARTVAGLVRGTLLPGGGAAPAPATTPAPAPAVRAARPERAPEPASAAADGPRPGRLSGPVPAPGPARQGRSPATARTRSGGVR
ncbi:TDT family transporter [Streptomyces sp. HSW2009]|uniref:TDT family transporter n=1 Tax=Streptomyces sp. HSW2009 TaxID=3142890 RepID=UPI0032EE6633